MKRIYISLLALMALPMAAQDAGFSVGGGLTLAPKSFFGSYDKAVNSSGGFYVTGGYTLGTGESNVSGRVNLSYFLMPGKARTYETTYHRQVEYATPSTSDPALLGLHDTTVTNDTSLKASLTLFQVSGDLVIQTGVPNLRAVFGVSINKYSASFSGKEITGVVYNRKLDAAKHVASDDTSSVAYDNNADTNEHFAFKDDAGFKGGFRMGLEYGFTKSLSAELLFQQTEFAGQNSHDSVLRGGGINPSWLQLGVSYKF
jgi:hypothetical protein